MEHMQALIEWLSSNGLRSWILQVFVVVLITVVLNFAQRRLLTKLRRRVDHTRMVWDNALVGAAQRPLNLLVWVLGLSFAIEIIRHEQGGGLFDLVGPAREVGVIFCLGWFLVRFIREAETGIIADRQARGQSFDKTTLDAVAKLLRLSVIITAGLVGMQTLGFSISGVLAFGGIGGIAVGFAAKDLLANFFGGLMIYLDRPFAVGDWIRSPDRDIEGTVEEISWRLTRIRTFDSRPLYIPNSAFTNIAVQNPSRMQNRRIYEYFGIRYDDQMKMGQIVAAVRHLLETHPEIDPTKTLMVNFDRCAPSSLDFFVYCFTRTTSWTKFHTVKQEVLLKILDIVAEHGAEVAFPTSTIHLTGAPAEPAPRPEPR